MELFLQHPLEYSACLAIVTLFIFALVDHFKAKKLLDDEQAVLYRLKASLLKKDNSFNSLITDLSQKNQQSSIARGINHIVLTRLVSPIGSMTFGFEGADSLARYFTGIFVFVGLFGTVSGIAFSVVQLAHVVSGSNGATAEQLSKVAESVRELLGSMGAAFSSTLFGILFTILMSFFNANFQSRETKLLLEAENWIYDSLLPRLEKNRSTTKDGFIKELEEYSPTQITAILHRSVEQLHGATLELNKTTQPLSQSAVSLAQIVSEATKWFHEIHTNTEATRENFVTAAGHLNEQTTRAGKMVAVTADMATKTSAITAEMLTRLQQAESLLTQNSDKFSSISEGLSNAAKSLATQQTALKEDIKQAVTDMGKSVRQLQEELAKDRANQNALMTQVAHGINQTDQQLNRILAQFQLTLTEMTAVAGSAELAGELAKFVSQIQVFLQEAHNVQKEVTELRTNIANETLRRAKSDEALVQGLRESETFKRDLALLHRQLKAMESQAMVSKQLIELMYEQSLPRRVSKGIDQLFKRNKPV